MDMKTKICKSCGREYGVNPNRSVWEQRRSTYCSRECTPIHTQFWHRGNHFKKVNHLEGVERKCIKMSRYTLDGEYVGEIESMGVIKFKWGTKGIKEVKECLEGKRESAFGYVWKYSNK